MHRAWQPYNACLNEPEVYNLSEQYSCNLCTGTQCICSKAYVVFWFCINC